MLTEQEAKRVGIRACMDELGYDFCMGHKDNAVSCWGMSNGYLNCYVGVNDQPDNPSKYDITKIDQFVLDGDDDPDWPFWATCDVSLEDGSVFNMQSKRP